MRLRVCLALFVISSFYSLYSVDTLITNGRAILAYGENQAYLISNNDKIYSWDPVALKWQLYAITTPTIHQFDALSDGSRAIGADSLGDVYTWNGVFGFGSSWTKVATGADWALLDPVTHVSRAKSTDWKSAWFEIASPTALPADPWNKYLPAGVETDQKMKQYFFIDKDTKRFHRWEKGDVGYNVALNRSSASEPFNIYYFGDDSDAALARITDPPISTHNIDDVFVNQISYDELYQNLWCVDQDGVPWRWDNTNQEWIRSDIRGDEGFQPDAISDAAALFRVQDDFYVRTTYIAGDHRPVIIVFKDTKILHLILGERSRADMTDVQIIIYEQRPPAHSFHTILELPHETPQKMVRVDDGKRIRENHYLERLLINNDVIASAAAISVYPAEHRIIRR